MDLARRAAEHSTDPDRRATWEKIVEEVEADREILGAMLESLDSRPNRIKALFAWAGEKVGRLKTTGPLSGPPELGQLLEFELMYLGVTGKLSLWTNLAAADCPSLREFDLDELIARAESQRDRLEAHKVSLSAEVFARSGTVA